MSKPLFHCILCQGFMPRITEHTVYRFYSAWWAVLEWNVNICKLLSSNGARMITLVKFGKRMLKYPEVMQLLNALDSWHLLKDPQVWWHMVTYGDMIWWQDVTSNSRLLHFVASHSWLYLTLNPEKIAPGIVVATHSARLHASDPQVQVLRCSSFSFP